MSCENTWYDLYFTQLFTTLGQLTAVVLSASVSVPVLSYYYPGINRFFKQEQDFFTKYVPLYCEDDTNDEASSDISDAQSI